MTQHWRYSFPNVNSEGWAIIFIDSVGSFTALSDWGNVGYRWDVNTDVRKLILTAGPDYLIDKLGQGQWEYDPEATLAAVKAHVENDEYLLEQIHDEFENVDTEFNFHRAYRGLDLQGLEECYCRKRPGDVLMFVKHVIPRLKEVLSKELGQAAADD